MTTPSPARARLAAALGELKARTGLSLAGLAAKTAFSKSSWDRYLNGRTLPPRDAVRELCRLAGEPEGRCVALWEIAEAEGSGRSGRPPEGRRPASSASSGTPALSPTPASSRSPASSRPPPPSSPPAGSPPPPASPAPSLLVPCAGGAADADADADAVHRTAAAVAVLASVCAVAVGGVAAVALLLPHGDGEPRSSLSPPPAATEPRCRGAVCEGKDPMHMKCGATPTTLAEHRTVGGAWMELRYSEECGTSWARMWGTRIGDRIEMTAVGQDGPEDPAGPVRSAEVQDAVDADSYVYTPMTAARPGSVVRACFRPTAGGEGECFDGRVVG
ncbi:DUF2690 domain-containing protein [Streptomyces sp. CA-251387]|uniref:helix-turn-helix domain-containing protein n=1 Tax=Streptomyces sp. CA-251387 TaxID=3240064 RepID=UPI003D8DD25F